MDSGLIEMPKRKKADCRKSRIEDYEQDLHRRVQIKLDRLKIRVKDPVDFGNRIKYLQYSIRGFDIEDPETEYVFDMATRNKEVAKFLAKNPKQLWIRGNAFTLLDEYNLNRYTAMDFDTKIFFDDLPICKKRGRKS